MIQQAIQKAVDGCSLTDEEAARAMDEIMSGEATGAQIGAYLTALRMKGETPEEIAASARIMREKGEKVRTAGDVLEIVGTGGDRAFSFNISTVSAIVAAAAGVPVAKHGNRSVSSKCGAADVLEALGIDISLSPAQVQSVFERTDICFMFAQVFHKSMKYAAGPRRELGVRTIFNILGPLANPAGARLQLLGVYDAALCEPMARVLVSLGVHRAMAVHGEPGLDEISPCGRTEVCEVNDGELRSYTLTPEDFGVHSCRMEDLTGGGAVENAAIAQQILAGQRGPKRDTVVINTAAALYIACKADSLQGCARLAEQTIDSGRAAAKLDEWIAATHSC